MVDGGVSALGGGAVSKQTKMANSKPGTPEEEKEKSKRPKGLYNYIDFQVPKKKIKRIYFI